MSFIIYHDVIPSNCIYYQVPFTETCLFKKKLKHIRISSQVSKFVFKGLARVLCMSKDKQPVDPFLRSPKSTRGGVGGAGSGGYTTRAKRHARDPRDHFTIAYAADQLAGRMQQRNANHNSGMQTYNAQYQSRGCVNNQNTDVSLGTGNTMYNQRDTSLSKNNTDSASTGLEDKSRECQEALIQDSIIEPYSLDDWRELARIMDRLFFWFTLLAMVFFCASVFINASI